MDFDGVGLSWVSQRDRPHDAFPHGCRFVPSIKSLFCKLLGELGCLGKYSRRE